MHLRLLLLCNHQSHKIVDNEYKKVIKEEKNVVEVIKEVALKTGKLYDWMNALCISETDISLTYEFSESLREYWNRTRDEKVPKGDKGINYDK